MKLKNFEVKAIGVVRILFGLVWLIDARFKWRPSFINDLVGYLMGALPGQPPAVQAWIGFWMDAVKINPELFAYFAATAKTALAFALIFGVLSNLADLGGAILAFIIWSTAEGFGGPYVVGSADIGAAIIYVFVFAMLFLSRAGLSYGLDRLLPPISAAGRLWARARSPRTMEGPHDGAGPGSSVPVRTPAQPSGKQHRAFALAFVAADYVDQMQRRQPGQKAEE